MDSKISNLNSATVLTDADVLPIVNGAETKKVSIATIKSTINGVPYTGATTNVDLGEYELKAGQIELDQSPTGTAGTAITRWNDTLGLTETTLKGGSVVLKNGADLVARIVNKVSPNTTLTKENYQVVKVSGAQGQRLAIDLAQANTDNNSADTLGVVIETIAPNQEGFIMTVGQLDGINTTGSLQGETWADGNVLYLSPTTAGKITNIKPTGATGHIVVIGYVEYSHINQGKIYVKIMNGWELDELHNVYISSEANEDFLQYESATQLWKNKQLTATLIRSKLGITTLSGSNTGDETSSTILSKLGYTPIKSIIKDTAVSSTVTGTTTETLTATYLIPANTFNANDIMKITSFLAEKTGTVGTCTMRIKVGSTNVFSSATTIATFIITSGANINASMQRNSLTLRGGFLRALAPGSTFISDIIAASAAFTSVTFNPAVDNYIFTSLQLSSTSDSAFQSNFIMTN